MSLRDDHVCPMENCALAYAAGELGADESDAVEAHVAECDACRAATSLLAELLMAETPDEEKMLDAIEAHTATAARELIRKKIEGRPGGRAAHDCRPRRLVRGTVEGPEFRG